MNVCPSPPLDASVPTARAKRYNWWRDAPRKRYTIIRGGRVARAAKQIQNEGEYQRAYRRQPSVKLHARYAKFRRVSNYFAAKRNRRKVDIYKKFQLEMTAARTKGKTGVKKMCQQ